MSLSISRNNPGQKRDDELMELLKQKGWKGEHQMLCVEVVTSTFDKVWSDETFGHIAVGMNANHVGRYLLKRAEWKSASPAFEYYVQIF